MPNQRKKQVTVTLEIKLHALSGLCPPNRHHRNPSMMPTSGLSEYHAATDRTGISRRLGPDCGSYKNNSEDGARAPLIKNRHKALLIRKRRSIGNRPGLSVLMPIRNYQFLGIPTGQEDRECPGRRNRTGSSQQHLLPAANRSRQILDRSGRNLRLDWRCASPRISSRRLIRSGWGDYG